MQIRKITIIDSEATQWSQIKDSETPALFGMEQQREEGTLYVLRLKNAAKDERLYMLAAPCDAQRYNGYGIALEDDKSLLYVYKSGDYPKPKENLVDDVMNLNNFNEYVGMFLAGVQSSLQGEASRKSSILNNEAYNEESESDEPPSSASPGRAQAKQIPSVFSSLEETNIKDFWGSDLLASVKKLNKMLNNGKGSNQESQDEQELKDNKDVSNNETKDEEKEARRLFEDLVQELKKTPLQEDIYEISKSAEIARHIEAVKNEASALNEKLKLTSRWEQFKKWMYRILGAIALAVPATMLGFFKAGPVGAAAGAVFGGVAGYYVGHRVGNFFSPARAKAEHANIINETAKKKMPGVITT
ncbi:MAG: hypothetical protein K0R24_1754 [Gammaproteobacteria bacterium]|jgi:hypothetical protein|nr:hypothetical protein [Gammaproteobacteria bacterium]MDF3055757.1 hypothetical protein [Gammaproteobacteria bacterium]